MRIATMVVTLVLLVAGAVYAAAPHILSYQGRLIDDTGEPIEGTVSVTFAVYTLPSGGSPLWSEILPVTTTAEGLFSVTLGEVTPLPASVWFDVDRWLGITVGADPELAPRTKFTSVPYAYKVETVDDALGGTIDGDVAVEGSEFAVFGEVNGGSTSSAGLKGTNNSSGGYGVRGESSGGDTPVGVSGTAQDGPGESYGVEGFSAGSGEEHIGVYGSAQNGTVSNRGVEGYVYGGASGTHNHGLYGAASSGVGTNYGVYARGQYGETNYGIYASAAGGTANWAGWFDGDVYISGDLTGGGLIGSGWVDDGSYVHLETSTDKVGIGTDVPDHELDVDGIVYAEDGILTGDGSISAGIGTRFGHQHSFQDDIDPIVECNAAEVYWVYLNNHVRVSQLGAEPVHYVVGKNTGSGVEWESGFITGNEVVAVLDANGEFCILYVTSESSTAGYIQLHCMFSNDRLTCHYTYRYQ